MPNQIIPVVWEKPLRKSAVNTLDKLNEVIDFINTSDIHEFSFIDGDTGREVVSGTSTQLATLDVFGECVQDGTPTPDNPVPVQVVRPRNLVDTETAVVGSLNANGTVNTSVTTRRTSDYFAVNAGTQYTVSTNGGTVLVSWYASDDTHIQRDNNNTVTAWTINAPANAAKARISWDEVAEFIQLEQGNHATPYTPYGCIGLQIGNDITPIDLQGHVLAGGDVLKIDSAGRVWIEQGALIETYDGSNMSKWSIIAGSGSGVSFAQRVDNTLTRVVLTANNSYCSACPFGSINATSTTIGFGNTSDQIRIRTNENGETLESLTAYFQANPTTFVFPLAETQTIELGTITPPPIPSGSVIKIAATLDPEFAIQWWTESAIPSVINGLKAYVDEQIETVNARIDELHGISRASIVRPDVSIPAIEFEPIEKITVDEIENDVEKEI